MNKQGVKTKQKGVCAACRCLLTQSSFNDNIGIGVTIVFLVVIIIVDVTIDMTTFAANRLWVK